MKLLSTINLPQRVAAIFQHAFDVSSGTVADAGALNADILLCSISSARLDRPTIEALPDSVKVIATYSVGLDHIDLAAAGTRGIAVFNTPGVLGDAVADAAMLLILAAARRTTESVSLIRTGAWTGWQPTQLLGLGLANRTLGILGMGDIGQRVAQRSRGFGMKIAYHNRQRIHGEEARYHEDPRELVRSSDIVLLAWPSTPTTRRFLNRDVLALAKREAIIVNIGRGDLVDDEALIACLREQRIFAAGLDVFDNEPCIHPGYLDLPNVFLTPHIGSSTWEARLAMARVLVEGITLWKAGGEPANRVV